MGWDIEVREKVYQRLANEIFFRILRGEYAMGAKLPLHRPCKTGWEQSGNRQKGLR